jgi:predicted Zn-dependent peptidase
MASPGWEASDVVADLLGRGRASRLHERLVMTGRAQAVSAWTYQLMDHPDRLTIDVTCRVDTDPDDVMAAVLNELEDLGATGPSEQELDRVRILRRTEHAADMERTQERADRIGMYASILGAPDRVDEEVARYESVGADEVQDFVSTYLTPDRAVRLTYVPTIAG